MPVDYFAKQKDACIINIEGAVAENHADADNTATNLNVFDNSTGQNIDIDQNATAIVNNIITVVIGPPYPIGISLNEAGKAINIEVEKDGQVKLNGESIEIKELNNGVKVMFLHSDKKKVAINNDEKYNSDNFIEDK